MYEPDTTIDNLWKAFEKICMDNAEGRTEKYEELQRLLLEVEAADP